MEQFRGILNKREHPIVRNCRKASRVPSTESYGPHLVRSNRRLQVHTASMDKKRPAESVASSPVCARPRTTELKSERSTGKVDEPPAKPRLTAESWNRIRSSFSHVKPTKTLLLRRKFNQEKIVSLGHTNSNALWKTSNVVKHPKYLYSAPNKTAVGQPPVNGPKPSWK